MMNGTGILYLVTFVANAAILVFEIAGARLLAPFFGTSVEVWSGTIAVVLGGMAIGYWAGGIIADRYPDKGVLGTILFGAGLAALLAWGLRDFIPALFSEMHVFSLTWATVGAALLLFAPMTIILAAVSPFIAKFLLTTLDSSAKTVGRINAVGTAGSITGALLSGLLLIPRFSLSNIFLGIALVLLALALMISSARFSKKMGMLVAIFGLSAFISTATSADLGALVRADIGTPYNRIWILEHQMESHTLRMVQTDPFGTQCAMRILPDNTVDESRIEFTYLKGFDAIARVTHDETTSLHALFLGGCNYSYPRTFLSHFKNASGTVVEIDPGMTRAAEEYFGFVPSRFPSLQVVHEDARRYAARATAAYDLIFMDTFGSSSNIPFHLTTQENFLALKHRLRGDGLLIINMIGPHAGPSSAFAASMIKTVSTIFPHTALYSFNQQAPSALQNLLIVASVSRELPDSFSTRTYPDLSLTKADISELAPSLVLTDDYAPVEYLTRTNRAL